MDQGSAIIIVGVMAFGGPFTVDYLRARRRRAERVEDFARQDAVSAKVDLVAATAKVSNAEVTGQLRTIHTLVNSDMTEARQGELDQIRLHLITLRKVVSLTAALGKDPSSEDDAAIQTAEVRVKELEEILADRAATARIIEDEARVAKTP